MRKRVGLVIVLILLAIVTLKYIDARSVEGATVVGRVINNDGNGVGGVSVTITSTTLKRECQIYSGCYCYAPNCNSSTTTHLDGSFNLVTDNMKFESDYYCNENGGPEVNITNNHACAPAGGPSYIDDDFDYIYVVTNETAAIIWENVYDSANVRYNYRIAAVCNSTNVSSCDRPLIQGVIPDQYGGFNTSWNYDLTPHLDQVADRAWNVKGVNPTLLTITIAGNIATFTPNNDKYGYDKVAFELIDPTTNLTDLQEVDVFVNKTLEFKEGWNLWSLPIVGNNSVLHVLSPLLNGGTWGCGRTSGNPYYCNPNGSDFRGNWTILWRQKEPRVFDYFWPRDNYQNIGNQAVKTIDPHYGYWIKVEKDVNLTMDFR